MSKSKFGIVGKIIKIFFLAVGGFSLLAIIASIADDTTTMYNTTAGNINVRAEASNSAKILGKIAPSQSVRLIAVEDAWSKIEYKNREAYVATFLIGSSKSDRAEKAAKKLKMQEQATEKKRIIRAAAAEETRAAKEELACRKELNCIAEKFSMTVPSLCAPAIERLAKFTVKWTDSWSETKFSHYKWKNQSRGIVTYIGDKIQFQNGFGAYQNYVYECDFDTRKKQPLYVRAEPGRL